MTNPQYLTPHHNTWIFQIKVPADMVEHEGRTVIRKTLKTGDIRTAKAKRDVELGRLQERWQSLREGVSDDPATIEWFQARAGDLRDELRTGSLTTAEADFFIGELLDMHLAKLKVEPGEEQVARIRDAVSSVNKPDEVTLGEAIRIYLEETKERVTTQTYNEKAKYINLLKEHHGLSDAEIEARQHEQLQKSPSLIAEWWRKVTQPISAEEK